MTYYVVKDTEGEADRLVLAPTAAQAIRHVAKRYTAKAATTHQVATFLTNGGKVESAEAEPNPC